MQRIFLAFADDFFLLQNGAAHQISVENDLLNLIRESFRVLAEGLVDQNILAGQQIHEQTVLQLPLRLAHQNLEPHELQVISVVHVVHRVDFQVAGLAFLGEGEVKARYSFAGDDVLHFLYEELPQFVYNNIAEIIVVAAARAHDVFVEVLGGQVLVENVARFRNYENRVGVAFQEVLVEDEVAPLEAVVQGPDFSDRPYEQEVQNEDEDAGEHDKNHEHKAQFHENAYEHAQRHAE